MSLFYQFLTENGTADPLFVLTENSLVAGVVGHPPIDLGQTSQASKYLG